MTTLVASIPSPGPDWRQVPIGQWLADLGVLGFAQGSIVGTVVVGAVAALLAYVVIAASSLREGAGLGSALSGSAIWALIVGALCAAALRFATPSWGIQTYALCLLTGMVAATILTGYRLRRRGVDAGVAIEVAVWAIAFGIVGARIFHVVTHPNDYFGEGIDPWSVFRVWEGGIAIFGAIIGGAVGIWLACRQLGLRFTTFVDALAPGLLIAQALGRMGNWFNNELFGQPTDLPWGLEIAATNPAFPVGLAEGTLFHPMFLYEIVWNLLGAALLLWLDRKRNVQWGRLIALYLVWYGAGRVVFESIRIDPSEVFFGLRTNVWVAIFAIVVGAVLYVVQTRRHPGLEPSPWVGQGETEAEGDVDSEVYADTPEAPTPGTKEVAAHPAAAAGQSSAP